MVRSRAVVILIDLQVEMFAVIGEGGTYAGMADSANHLSGVNDILRFYGDRSSSDNSDRIARARDRRR